MSELIVINWSTNITSKGYREMIEKDIRVRLTKELGYEPKLIFLEHGVSLKVHEVADD